MAKTFSEVFPTVPLRGELQDLFRDTQVTRVAYSKDHQKLRIYLDSRHLIHNRHIREMEAQLTRRVCGGSGVRAVLVEHYSLSQQYNPEMLLHEYMDSLAEEFWQVSPILGSFFREASFDYPEEDQMRIHLEDSGYARDEGETIRRMLADILRERCDMDCEITLLCDRPVRKRAKAVLDETEAERRAPAAAGTGGGREGRGADDAAHSMDSLQAAAG